MISAQTRSAFVARETASHFSGSFACPQVGEAVERALQDEDRRVLVDHLGAAGAADVIRNQLALDGRGREPLVPERDRKIGQTGEITGKGAGRLRAWPFA